MDLTCYWYHLEITWNHLWCAILNSVLSFLMLNKLFKRTEDCSVIFSITTGETASIQGSDGFTCSSRDLFWRFLDRGHATSIWQICHNQRDFGPKDKKFVANVKNYWLCPFKFVGMALAVVAEDRQIIDVLEELFAEQVWFLKLVVSYSIALHWTRNLPLKIMVLHSIRYPYTFWFPNIYMPVVLEHYIVYFLKMCSCMKPRVRRLDAASLDWDKRKYCDQVLSSGNCNYNETSIQSVHKIERARIERVFHFIFSLWYLALTASTAL